MRQRIVTYFLLALSGALYASLSSCDFFEAEPRESWMTTDTTKWLYLGLEGQPQGFAPQSQRLRRFGDYLYAPVGQYGLYRLDLFGGPAEFAYVGHLDTSRVALDGKSCFDTPCAGAADILVSDHHPGVVLVARYPGLARSSDGGESWTVSDGATQPLEHVRAMRELGDGTVIATRWNGVIMSRNGGASWTVAADSLAQCCFDTVTIAGDGRTAAIGGHAFLGWGSWRVYRTDGGSVWRDVSVPPNEGDFIHDLVFPDPDNADLMVLAQGPLVYRTTDGGNEWSLAHAFGPGRAHLANGERAGDLIAAYRGGSGTPLRFFRSTDSGITWDEIYERDIDDGVVSVKYDRDLERLFVWTFNRGVFAFDPD